MSFDVQQINHACFGVVDLKTGRFIELFTTEAAAQAEADRRERMSKKKAPNDVPDDKRP